MTLRSDCDKQSFVIKLHYFLTETPIGLALICN